MSRHIAILGFIFTINAVLALLAGGALVLFGTSGGLLVLLTGQEDALAAGGVLAALGWGLGLLVLFGGLLSGAAAYGLFARRRWGQVLGIALSVLNVLSFTLLWTPVGLYGLWALIQGNAEFQRPR